MMRVHNYLFVLLVEMLFLPAGAQVRSTAGLASQAPGFAVLELFTSQGCSSCPAADRLLSEIIAEAAKSGQPVYALSFHVDYWNKLGWKDPYSRLAFTRRQNNYVSARGGKEVYTPQVFVNGKTGFVGSDARRLREEMDKALARPATASLTIQKDSLLRDTLFLGYHASPSGKNLSLVVAVVQGGIRTAVGKGENAGRTLRHDNVVRVFHIVPLARVSGTAAVPVRNMPLGKDFSVIAYVQQKQTKEILAATGMGF